MSIVDRLQVGKSAPIGPTSYRSRAHN